MNSIAPFKDIHKGKTILIVGNGLNLGLTPPEKFNYPSIGVNEIHLYEEIFSKEWAPTYYTAVDKKNMSEYGEKISEQFSDIPKFVLSPRMEKWKGENFYHYRGGTGLLWPKDKKKRLWAEKEDLILKPWVYGNITHVAIKLAYFMGAKTILIIGLEHEPHKSNVHFWGVNEKTSINQPTKGWQDGYKILADELKKRKVKLLNISQGTFVPDSIIPVDDWKKYTKKSKKKVVKEQDND